MATTFSEKLRDVGVAQFADLMTWKPSPGDFVIFNGWFRHWFGVVVTTQPGEVDILCSVLPVNVFSMGPNAQKKHTKKIDVIDIHRSRSGAYAIIQAANGQTPVVYIR